MPFQERIIRIRSSYLSLSFLAISLTAMNCSSAADFGDVQLRSYLGQPFSAQLTVSGASQNLIDPNCYKSKVEALDGSVLSVPRITLGKARADGQTAQLFFSSRELINEPAVKFKVESLCDG